MISFIGIAFSLINLRIALHHEAAATRRTTMESMRWKMPSARNDTVGTTTTGLPESEYTSSLSTMQFPEVLPLRSRNLGTCEEEKDKIDSSVSLEPKVVIVQGPEAC